VSTPEARTRAVALVTPEGSVYEGEAEMLIVPGDAGEIGVLARHAPLVALLKAGSTRVHIRRGQDVREFATGPGFFKVEQDRALALVDHAVNVDDIDREVARAQLEAARAELERLERGESDRWQLEQRVKHAENQLAVANGTVDPPIRAVAPPAG
jgi:F-type H+-transporting ATPase subunit epsilon